RDIETVVEGLAARRLKGARGLAAALVQHVTDRDFGAGFDHQPCCFCTNASRCSSNTGYLAIETFHSSASRCLVVVGSTEHSKTRGLADNANRFCFSQRILLTAGNLRLEFFEPNLGAGVGGGTPISAGRKRPAGGDFRTVGQG